MAKAVGHIPSGLFIVCAQTQKDEVIDGYLASWIQQVSFTPLLLTLAIKPGRPVFDLIMLGQVFTINVVGDHDRSYLKHFWKGHSPDANPFADIPHFTTEQGGVALKDAKSYIDCKMKDKISPGDHHLVIAQVLASETLDDKARPVTHVRKTGPDQY